MRPIVLRGPERRIVAKTFIDLTRMMRSVVCEDVPMGPADPNSTTALLVSAAILIGHVEGRPMNASKLSLYLALPRTTVLRHLRELQRLGVIKNHNGEYELTEERAAASSPHIPKAIGVLSKAYTSLREMSSSETDTKPPSHQ
jgi:DNA-binding transcriptional ArsR family regulator